MINTNPSVAEIDATFQLLSVLELAKDATKLKESLKSIKDALYELHEKSEVYKELIQKNDQSVKRINDATIRAEREQAKANADIANVAKGFADLDDAKRIMKADRDKFDLWMAEQRESLARASADVNSKAAQVRNLEAEIEKREAGIASKEAKLDDAIKQAQAKQQDYEAKIASLKQVIS
jgi:chromosome segregation ATPase